MLAIYTFVYILTSFLQEMYDKTLGKSNKTISQITFFSKKIKSYLLLWNINYWIVTSILRSLFLGPEWNLELKYITAIGLLKKVNYTYMFCRSFIDIQIRMPKGTYKSIYYLGPPGKINNIFLNRLLAIIMTKLTSRLCNYRKNPYGKDANLKRQFYEAMKSTDKMTIFMQKCTLVTRINQITFLGFDKQKYCCHFTRLVETIVTDNNQPCMDRGSIKGKTTKMVVLPGLCLTVSSGGCRGALIGLRAPLWQGHFCGPSGRKYIPKSADRILVKSWIEFFKAKNCPEILPLNWLVQTVGTHFHQNGHGKIAALKTCMYRPCSNQNRFQVFDINHKYNVSYPFTLVIKLDKFIFIDFIICKMQFSKSKVGLNLSLVFNDASKNLCGITRPYRMSNTTIKVNVNSWNNNLKHALNYLLLMFMSLGGQFKSPNKINIIYDQKESPKGYDYMKSNGVGHNLTINGNSYIILCEFKSKKFALLKHALNYLLLMFMILGGQFKSPNKLSNDNWKALSIKIELEYANSYILCLMDRVHKYKKNIANKIQYDCIGTTPVHYIYKLIISLRMNTRSLWTSEPRWKSGKEYHMRAIKSCGLDMFYPIFKNHFLVFKEVFSENSILRHGLFLRADSNQERPIMAIKCNSYSLVFEFKSKKFALLTLWQLLKLIYCQIVIVKNYDTIKSGKYNNYKSHGLNNDNRKALYIKCELESNDSFILCPMIRLHQRNKIIAKKRQYDSIGTTTVFYMYKQNPDLDIFYSSFRNHLLVCKEILSEIKSRITNSRIVPWLVPPAGRRLYCCQQNKLSINING